MVKIIYENGIPFIEINGEKLVPAAFRSFRPKPDNISLMTRAGVRLCQMLVSGSLCTNGSPYSLFGGVWKGDGIYDFAAFDRQFEMFRRFAPDAYFNVMIHLDTPEWWAKSHPGHEPDSYHHVTEAALDEEYVRSASDYLKALISYAEEKYGDRIFGYSIAAGCSNEWFDMSLYEAKYDRSHNVLTENWRKIIGKPNVPAPTIASMEAGESSLREKASDEYRYLELACNATADLACEFAAAAQEILKHEKLLGLFFGYVILDYQNYWNTNAYEKVWRSPDIDMLYSPTAYGHCRDLDGVSSYQYAVDSIRLNGKLYLHEDDHRTELAAFPLENGVMLKNCYQNFYEFREVFRREMANTLAKQSAFWWFDFFGGYYNAPEYEAELTYEMKIFSEMSKGERHSVSEIAVFVDPMSFNCIKEGTRLCTNLVRRNMHELHRCGAPYDYFNLNDFGKIERDYKLYVFLNSIDIEPEIRDAIGKKSGTKVWLYAPDVVDGDGHFDFSRISKLVGMSVEKYSSDDPRAVYDDVEFGFTKAIEPMFRVEGGEPIAFYKDGNVAVAKSGANIYAALGLPCRLWRDIARDAGVFIYDENGGGLAAASDFVCSYTTLRENCELNMPEDGKYVEVWSGEEYECVGGKLRYHAEKGRTMMFRKTNI